MRSCLEIESMDARHEMEVRSDYTRLNQYSPTHPDALATGDRQGKGTGAGAPAYWLPDCTGQIGIIRYDEFDTAVESGAGNDQDNEARNEMMVRSLYNSAKPYGNIDTSANVLEGQYNGG